MANKSIKLLFFNKNVTHFLLPTVIENRLKYSLLLNIVKRYLFLSKIQTSFAVLLKPKLKRPTNVFRRCTKLLYKCCLFAIVECYITKLLVIGLFEII